MAEQNTEAPAAPPAGESVKAQVPQIVLQRVGDPKSLEGVSDDELKAILKEYYDRWVNTENTLYDIQYGVRLNDMQIQELEMELSDMRGKFILPKLKKVHNFKLMGGDE
ncbi:hypothetical protein TCAL_00204 [Tigriopus californicus]|uniref:Uncharacterized protein n=1 Tax=Tigriopus californicus TaxID=6832 RepID=A0A553P362_TIGCA|nr:troponin I-like [Tigriopus californicus]TRY72138.1 hypothetical protein TCAL_00204 [Tigriopus californicus]